MAEGFVENVVLPAGNVVGNILMGLLLGPDGYMAHEERKKRELMEDMYARGFVGRPTQGMRIPRGLWGQALEGVGLLDEPSVEPLSPAAEMAMARGGLEALDSSLKRRDAELGYKANLFGLEEAQRGSQEKWSPKMVQARLQQALLGPAAIQADIARAYSGVENDKLSRNVLQSELGEKWGKSAEFWSPEAQAARAEERKLRNRLLKTQITAARKQDKFSRAMAGDYKREREDRQRRDQALQETGKDPRYVEAMDKYKQAVAGVKEVQAMAMGGPLDEEQQRTVEIYTNTAQLALQDMARVQAEMFQKHGLQSMSPTEWGVSVGPPADSDPFTDPLFGEIPEE
jgi:hypothetical protein